MHHVLPGSIPCIEHDGLGILWARFVARRNQTNRARRYFALAAMVNRAGAANALKTLGSLNSRRSRAAVSMQQSVMKRKARLRR
jgi:hypothetical protein